MRRKLLLAITLGIVATFAAALAVGCSKTNNADDTPKHNYGEWVIDREATCQEAGRKYHVCQDEGCNNMEWELIPKTTHKYDIINRTNAGHSFTCSVCKTTTEIEAHNFKNGICTGCGADEGEDLEFSYRLSNDESYYCISGVKNKNATEIVIPSNYKGKPVKEIDFSAFNDCNSLEKITISDNISNIYFNTFENCNKLVNISVCENNEYYKSVDGNLYSKDATTLVRYIGKQTEFEIPQTVTTISSNAFSNSSTLTKITIPDNVTVIDQFAFENCSSLECVKLPESLVAFGMLPPDGSFRWINGYVFANCKNLKSITLPKNIEYAAFDSCFSGCLNLETVNLPNNISYIVAVHFKRVTV